MSLTCAAVGCLSDERTKGEGNDISLFPFPEDENRREKWMTNCRFSVTPSKEEPLYLCGLHFEKECFTSPQELKPDAVPTVFSHTEDHDRKRKAEGTFQSEPSESPAIKQKKLGEESNTIITPPQSPLPQLTNNDKDTAEGNNTKSNTDDCIILTKDSDIKSDSCQENKLRKPNQVYRLTIQIDKICGKPCPRSVKFCEAEFAMPKENQSSGTEDNQVSKSPESQEKAEKKTGCREVGCKLKQTMYNSKPAYQCEYCDKFYVTRQYTPQRDNPNVCSICKQTFPTSQKLFMHIKSHFICDLCKIENHSKVSYDKHMRLHATADLQHPYKCHQCNEIFQLKDEIRQHYQKAHPNMNLQSSVFQGMASKTQTYRCTSCNITFRNEEAYRNHVSSHKQKVALRRNLGDPKSLLPIANPLTGSQIGILRAVKFSCRVCSMEFDNVREVDKHTRTHLGDTEDEQRCNICRKVFRSSEQFAEHLKFHLSRAHPCPFCPKAFINQDSLKNHFKTHGKVFAL